MIQFKIFQGHNYASSGYTSADTLANQWLNENPDVQIIDFKYQANASITSNDFGIDTEFHQSICILYKTND